MTEVKAMPRIKARSTFGSVVARARLTRPELAAAAGISARTIDALANPSAAHRQGFTREVTAWKIAHGFAKLTQQSDDEAFAQLFEGDADAD